MKFTPTRLPDVVIVEPDVLRDERGYFVESYHRDKYAEGGLEFEVAQQNQSLSRQGTLRGLHAQLHHPQGKLVWVAEGEIFDVAVDLRPSSLSFGGWVGVTLSADNWRRLWIPPGFAHGFCVTSESAVVQYLCSATYRQDDEIGVRWNDPAIAIEWPVKEPILSARDAALPLLAQVVPRLSEAEGAGAG